MPLRHGRRPSFVPAVVAAICGIAAAAPSPEARVAQGRLAGEAGADGVRVYRGIPYAAPPVGELRWREPQPPASWSGVRDATHFGARCIQAAGNPGIAARSAVAAALPTSEDCLYLNVWTAAHGARDRRPVVVYLHGGSFLIGTGALFDGAALAKRGVVVVTLNYRLGAFGLFAHPALTAESTQRTSGNFTVDDARAALEWVQENIAAFGGDPRKVTVMGQSAGGRLVHILRTSPCARGLFRRAIIESAPVRIAPLRTLAQAQRDGEQTAVKLAAPTLAQLRALSAQQVLENFPVGLPVIDGRCIPEDPLRAIDTNGSHDVDLLVGSNADEGTFPYLRAKDYGMGFASAAEYSTYARDRFAEDAPAFLELYAAADASASEQQQREAFRDETAWLARFTAAAHARRREGSTFLYYFTHRPPAPATGPDRGATHAAELSYAFGTPAANWRDEDRRVADVMSAYWANFVARGDPNGPDLPQWPRFTADAGVRMNLGSMSAEPGLDASRVAIFDALYRRTMGRTANDQRSGE